MYCIVMRESAEYSTSDITGGANGSTAEPICILTIILDNPLRYLPYRRTCSIDLIFSIFLNMKAFVSRCLHHARSKQPILIRRTLPQQPQRHFSESTNNILDSASSAADTPKKSISSLFVQRAEEGYAIVHKFRRTITEILLWMVLGSLALELKSLKSDQKEYLKTLDVQKRKLESQIEALSSGQMGTPQESFADAPLATSTPSPLPSSQPSRATPSSKLLIY
ncbi:hypothetical protein BC829DRAFT_379474 [Chytridium lagenaria]|nr:hypothetical protein BC829DRAFT_379474 [Chytridium lagenaria]